MSSGRLDLTTDPNFSRPSPIAETEAHSSQPQQEQRKYLGIRFNCCGLYVRIYANKEGTAYEGRCPKCAKPVKLKIGESGTNNRFFDVF